MQKKLNKNPIIIVALFCIIGGGILLIIHRMLPHFVPVEGSPGTFQETHFAYAGTGSVLLIIGFILLLGWVALKAFKSKG